MLAMGDGIARTFQQGSQSRTVGFGSLCFGLSLLGFSSHALAQAPYSTNTNQPGVPPGDAKPATAPNETGAGAPATVPPAWTLTPSLEIGEAYNDNVNLAPPGAEVWDVITTITPGLQLLAN